MQSDVRTAYDLAARATGSSRQIESTVLFKAARLLETCRAQWGEPGHTQRLFDALRYNQRLWGFFQTELSRPECEMPPALRLNLLQLSVFVDRRTFAVLAEPEPRKLQVLIDINRNVAEGLLVRVPEGSSPA